MYWQKLNIIKPIVSAMYNLHSQWWAADSKYVNTLAH